MTAIHKVKPLTPERRRVADRRVSPAIGEFAVLELQRVRQVNARLLLALELTRATLDDAMQEATSERREWCPKCEQLVKTIDDGETCAQCKLVL